MGNMMEFNCENVRDLLPELISDRLDSVATASVRSHIARCVECQEEYEVALRVAGTRLRVPAGLEQRVIAAAVGRRGFQWTRGRMAAAATIAVAVIGGSTWLSQMLPRHDTPVRPVPIAESTAAPAAGFIGVDDAFVSGTSSLSDLTVEELQKLLVEMGS
jgi:hypothetical protein